MAIAADAFRIDLAHTKQGRARFRLEFERHLREVVMVYREANVEVSSGGPRATLVVIEPACSRSGETRSGDCEIDGPSGR